MRTFGFVLATFAAFGITTTVKSGMSALVLVAGTVLGGNHGVSNPELQTEIGTGVGIAIAAPLDLPPQPTAVWAIAREASLARKDAGPQHRQRPLSNRTFAEGFDFHAASIRVNWFDRDRVGSEDDLRTFLRNYMVERFEQILNDWRWADMGGLPIITAEVTDSAGATGVLIIESRGSFLRTSFKNASGVWKFGTHRNAPALSIASQRPEIQLPKLEHSDPEVRFKAVAFLAECGAGQEQVGRGLLPMLRDRDPRIRGMTAYALGCVGTPVDRIVPALIETLGDDRASVRVEAARGLIKFGSEFERSAPALLTLLADPEPAVRSAACLALGLLGTAGEPETVALILQVTTERLADPAPDVRLAALSALGELASRSTVAIPAIQEATLDPDRYVAGRARDVLQSIKRRQATQ